MNPSAKHQQCDPQPHCHWEKKYYLKLTELKSLESQFNQQSLEYSEKIEGLQLQVKTLESNKSDYSRLQEKLLKQRRKLKNLEQVLVEREKEITILQATIDFSNGKISNLRKCRQQSFDTISVLEAEIQRTQALCQTPTKPKKKKQRKANPSMFEIKTQILSFGIPEVVEHKKKDLEMIIDSQLKTIQDEENKRKNLENQIESLLAQRKSLESTVEALNGKISECQQKNKKIKEKIEKVLKEKIEKLRIENSELRFQLKEYEEKENGFWNSELETTNELSSIDSFPRSRSSEETLTGKSCDFSHLKEKIESLEEKNRALTAENQSLQQDIKKRKKTSLQLNKILQENQKMFESFKKSFSPPHLQQEIKKLTAEKAALLKETQRQQQELTKLNEALIYKKITEKPKFLQKTIQESPKESSVLKTSNRQKLLPQDYKKRRNIASWCNFQVFPKF